MIPVSLETFTGVIPDEAIITLGFLIARHEDAIRRGDRIAAHFDEDQISDLGREYGLTVSLDKRRVELAFGETSATCLAVSHGPYWMCDRCHQNWLPHESPPCGKASPERNYSTKD